MTTPAWPYISRRLDILWLPAAWTDASIWGQPRDASGVATRLPIIHYRASLALYAQIDGQRAKLIADAAAHGGEARARAISGLATLDAWAVATLGNGCNTDPEFRALIASAGEWEELAPPCPLRDVLDVDAAVARQAEWLARGSASVAGLVKVKVLASGKSVRDDDGGDVDGD